MLKVTSIKLYFFALLAAGCSTKPITTPGETDVVVSRWETKAQVVNKSNNKRQNLNIDIVADNKERTRLEVSAMMGYPVATVVMKEDVLYAAIHTQKKFFTGAATANSLRAATGIALDPKVIIALAEDNKELAHEWKCQSDASGALKSCADKNLVLEINWLERKADSGKKIQIKGDKFEMTWAFIGGQTSVQYNPAQFSLNPPTGYKTIHIK